MGLFFKKFEPAAPSPCREGRVELIDGNVGVRGGAPAIIPIDDRWQQQMSELLRGPSNACGVSTPG